MNCPELQFTSYCVVLYVFQVSDIKLDNMASFDLKIIHTKVEKYQLKDNLHDP